MRLVRAALSGLAWVLVSAIAGAQAAAPVQPVDPAEAGGSAAIESPNPEAPPAPDLATAPPTPVVTSPKAPLVVTSRAPEPEPGYADELSQEAKPGGGGAMIAIGAGIGTLTWLATVAVIADYDEWLDGGREGYIPIVGPWIVLANSNCRYCQYDKYVLSGVGQALGVGLVTAGILKSSQGPSKGRRASAQSGFVAPAPLVGPGRLGLGVVGAF